MKLDPFYPIVSSSGWIARIVPLGVKLVQLRIKDLGGDKLRQEIAVAKAICDTHGCTLVINDHWEIAIEEKCGFLHLGQEDLDEADLDDIRKAGLRLGVSTHDGDELDRALSVSPDYIAIGPVYPTQSKEVKFAPQGLDKVSGWKKAIGDLPLVAIGGITLERAEGVFLHGADSIAVLSDVTGHTDPERRATAWIDGTAGRR
ncbi:thiamine phosphate synthase [Roseibium denhamense]|uniref:Thiamine-phosphate synthase n=1 Tax=Roseibium denhamense TaxID=76305 RepID=A0ABY1NVP0_9HYPH|nr:thiamine phosphate synthase [Roseibium denhamense]MTI03977.1 thiamine phosphate synthase [Roseibium denhamense]SMP17089.1 thiamine-phosphate diphosphorylase [Roseibium denhamense]